MDRKLDSDSGSAATVVFNVNRQEKGNKILTSTDVLLELESTEYILNMIGDMKENEPVKEFLENVMTQEFREKFRTHFWGDVCTVHASSIANTLQTQSDTNKKERTPFNSFELYTVCHVKSFEFCFPFSLPFQWNLDITWPVALADHLHSSLFTNQGTHPPSFPNAKLPKIIYHLGMEVANSDGSAIGKILSKTTHQFILWCLLRSRTEI